MLIGDTISSAILFQVEGNDPSIGPKESTRRRLMINKIQEEEEQLLLFRINFLPLFLWLFPPNFQVCRFNSISYYFYRHTQLLPGQWDLITLILLYVHHYSTWIETRPACLVLFHLHAIHQDTPTTRRFVPSAAPHPHVLLRVSIIIYARSRTHLKYIVVVTTRVDHFSRYVTGSFDSWPHLLRLLLLCLCCCCCWIK